MALLNTITCSNSDLWRRTLISVGQVPFGVVLASFVHRQATFSIGGFLRSLSLPLPNVPETVRPVCAAPFGASAPPV